MHLSTLILENFRSYPHRVINLSPTVNLIVGHNGSGKTNILEAIYFLSCGKSFRSSSMSQLISWNSTYTSVRGQLNDSQLEAQLIKNTDNSTLSRQFKLDEVVKTRPKYLGTMKCVVFEPEDIRLVNGSPTRRRDYLDSVFTTTEWRYASALSQFHKALKHRNELLDQVRDGKSQKSELFYWDQSLIKNSEIIHTFRQKYIKSVNQFFQEHQFSEIKTIFLSYQPSILTQEKLDSSYYHDLNTGYTQLGVHRDDFSFNNTVFSAVDKNLAFWGSRGQQRLAVLALRLAQINYLEATYSQKPILLLDDIFSELDQEHRQLVVDICQQYQTVFTSAETEISQILPNCHLLNLTSSQN